MSKAQRTASSTGPAATHGGAGAWRSALLGLILLTAQSIQGQETATTATRTDLTELPLERLLELDVPKVSGASKFEQKTTEAPSSVTVISGEEITRYGHRTLADVLQSVQGFNVS